MADGYRVVVQEPRAAAGGSAITRIVVKQDNETVGWVVCWRKNSRRVESGESRALRLKPDTDPFSQLNLSTLEHLRWISEHP